jgi:hypothetical protein
MKTAGDDYLLPFLVVEVVLGKAEVDHPVDVISVSQKIAAEIGFVLAQYFLDKRYPLFNGSRHRD